MEHNFTSLVTSNFFKMMKRFDLPEKYNLIVGFSGGADSATLLHLAYTYRETFGYNLYAIHINHLIRAKEADRDEDFCMRVCDIRGIPFKSKRIDVPTLSKERKTGLEETARNVRYAEFEKYAEKISENGFPSYIATAHNADDNVETIIFNIARGTSLNGLCGIKPQRDIIIRPLLLCGKDDILGYCDENCIEYITDSTNIDKAYTRNRIRHDLIPSLKGINPSLLATISRMTENTTQDEKFIKLCAEDFLLKNSDNRGIKLSELNKVHNSLKKHTIVQYIKNMLGVSLEDKHISGIIELCDAGVKHSEFHFTGNYCACIEDGYLTLKSKESGDEISFNVPVNFGITKIPGGVIGRFYSADTKSISEFENVYKISTQTPICSDKIKGVLLATSRNPGDTYNINGINRKVKKLLNEIETNLSARSVLPVFRDDNGILWIPGARSRTGSFPKDSDNSEILIYASDIKNNI